MSVNENGVPSTHPQVNPTTNDNTINLKVSIKQELHEDLSNISKNNTFSEIITLESILQQARDEYPHPQFLQDEVKAFIERLLIEDSCIELRAIGNKSASAFEDQQTKVGFYNDLDALMRDCKEKHGKNQLYIGLNPRNSALLRPMLANRLSAGKGAKADDVIARRYLPIDIDITRPAGTGATDEEIKAAYPIFKFVTQDFLNKGIEPVCGFSGNGFHLLIATIPYANDKEMSSKNNPIALLIRYFNRKYGTDYAKVDATTYDIGRVWKVYGTAAIKGENTNDRPWRTARLIIPTIWPEPCDILQFYENEIAEQRLFEASIKHDVSKEFGSSQSNGRSETNHWARYNGDISSLDIVKLCKEKQLYCKHIEGNVHAIKCPFADEHTVGHEGDGSTIIFNKTDKWPGWHCKHAHCAHRKLEDFLSIWKIEEIDRFCEKAFNSKSNLANSAPIPILPLIRSQEKSIKYPAHELGEILGTAAEVIQEVMQAPLAICAQSLLASAALLAQPHVNLLIDGRVSPASLFFLTIAESGDRKSAVDKIVHANISKFERVRMERYQQERIKYEEDKSIFKKSNGNNNSGCKAPQPPICPLLRVQEPTYEGIFRHFASGPHSLGLFADEGGRMLSGYAMNKDNMLKTIAGFSELWDGSGISRMRGSEHVEKLYDKRLSMHLLVQPVVAKKIFSDPIMLGQGFLARMLSWHPETLAGTRLYKRVNIYSTSAVQEFNARVDEILDLLPPLKSDVLNYFKPRDVQLSEQAYDTFQKFHDDVEIQISSRGKFVDIKPFASKAAELAARIALVIQFFHNPNLEEISDLWMQRGCRLVLAYLQEANRLWGDEPIDENIELAETTRLWLYTRQIKLITGKELYQNAPKQVRSKTKAQAVVKVLVDHGFLKPLLAKCSQSFASKTWEVVNEDLSNS